MRRKFFLLAAAMMVLSTAVGEAIGQTATVSQPPSQIVSTTESYVCSKCGKLHTRDVAIPSAGSTQPYRSETPGVATPTRTEMNESRIVVQRPAVAASAPVAATSRLSTSRLAGRRIRNVLAALNAQRQRRGIGSLRFDPQLQAVAERRAQLMAARGLKGHPPGSFSPGRYEGVGWSSSYSPSGVSACYTSDPRMQYAGAAMATGRDGVYFAVVYR